MFKFIPDYRRCGRTTFIMATAHDRARRLGPARRVSTLLERSVAVLRLRDQHQRQVIGVSDVLARG
jgi:hypothetical protein